jgi:hypothetical protein
MIKIIDFTSIEECAAGVADFYGVYAVLQDHDELEWVADVSTREDAAYLINVLKSIYLNPSWSTYFLGT